METEVKINRGKNRKCKADKDTEEKVEENGGGEIRKQGGEKEGNREKKKLKREKVWITEDLTWEERRMRWRMGEIARREEGKGN